jgi:hypothetical protein
MTSITEENPTRGHRLKLIKPTLIENKAPTTKSPKMAHSRCSPMHELMARLVQHGKRYSPPPSNIFLESYAHRASFELSHKGNDFSSQLHHSKCHIGRRELMFETQIMTEGFEMRVFKLTSIVAMNSSNSISIPLILQP